MYKSPSVSTSQSESIGLPILSNEHFTTSYDLSIMLKEPVTESLSLLPNKALAMVPVSSSAHCVVHILSYLTNNLQFILTYLSWLPFVPFQITIL